MTSDKESKTRNYRLCCITNNVQSGGAGKSLLVLVKQLSKYVDISLFARTTSLPDSYRDFSSCYHRIRSGFFPLHYLSGARPPFFINYAAWLLRCIFLPATIGLVKKQKPDIVLINGFQGVWCLPFLPTAAKKIVYARELLDMSRYTSRLMVKLVDRYADHVICITENEKDALANISCPVSVVYNSFSEEWAAEPEVKVKSSSNDEIRIAIFGTIQHAKGQYLVIELLRKYRAQLEELNARFLIYGAASTLTTRKGGREELKAEVIRSGLEKYIEFPGWTDDVSAAMQSIDVVLRTDTSGCPWGRDVIEAMGNGMPVVAAGTSEVFIKPGKTGLLFRPVDIDDMAEKLLQICRDEKLRSEIGRNAYEFARKNFDQEINARKVLSILDHLKSYEQL